MPNFYVFPGGAIDSHDASPEWSSTCSRASTRGTILANYLRAPAPKIDFKTETLADRVGVIREVFEETGVLLAAPSVKEHDTTTHTFISESKTTPLEDRLRYRDLHRAVLEDGTKFFGLLHAQGLIPAVDTLYPFARWITPVGEPRRFDTLFYLAPIETDDGVLFSLPGHPERKEDAEVTLPLWIEPAKALEMSYTNALTLAPPTVYVLSQLAAFSSINDLLRYVSAKSAKNEENSFLVPWQAERHIRGEHATVSSAGANASPTPKAPAASAIQTAASPGKPMDEGKGFIALPGDIAHPIRTVDYLQHNKLPLSSKFAVLVAPEEGPYHRIVLQPHGLSWRVVTSNASLVQSESRL